ncbi:unnamed protein product [Scytosiphon promiscuus]
MQLNSDFYGKPDLQAPRKLGIWRSRYFWRRIADVLRRRCPEIQKRLGLPPTLTSRSFVCVNQLFCPTIGNLLGDKLPPALLLDSSFAWRWSCFCRNTSMSLPRPIFSDSRSLLVFERESKDVAATSSSSTTTTTTTTTADSISVMRFRHYDSSEGSNRQPAERTAENFLRMFDGSLVEPNVAARVEHVRDAPQQSNAFDCGMYTVLLAERLASKATAAGAAPSTTAAVVEQPATTAALPVVAPEEVAVGATPAVEPRGTKISRQDSDTVISRRESEVARDGASGDVGGGRGIGGFGGGPEGVAVTRGDVSSGVETISSDFVSSARALAREKLSRCIRSQGWC